MTTIQKRSKRVQEISALKFAQAAYLRYGSHTIEQRAVPDGRDGLKPVHRMILWTALRLGLTSGARYAKCAAIVGKAIGDYHPHGDASVYAAMVKMAGTFSEDRKHWVQRNTLFPTIEGFGNFGDFTDSAAAMRYTEARLSKFAEHIMLDADYLAVTPKIRNYSDTLEVPLVLPAKLPVMLLTGSTSMAVAVRGGCPAFSFESLLPVLRKAAEFELTARDCMKLVPAGTYGGRCVSPAAEFQAFIKTGKGSLKYVPTYRIEGSNIILTSVCPGMDTFKSFSNSLVDMSKIVGVRSVEETTGGGEFSVTLRMAPRVKPEEVARIEKEMVKLLTKTISYDVIITERKSEDDVEFRHVTVHEMINDWMNWRVGLEEDCITERIRKIDVEIRRLELYILACQHLKIIFDSLKVEDSAAYLKRHLKISLEDANTILDLKVRQLKALELQQLRTKLSNAKTVKKNLQRDLKNPEQCVLKSFDDIEQLYKDMPQMFNEFGSLSVAAAKAKTRQRRKRNIDND